MSDDAHPTLGQPFRVEAKLRNNRLVRARELCGYANAKAAAAASGVSYSIWIHYEALQATPWRKRAGVWRSTALAIAKFLRQLPEDLWPEVIERVEATRASFEVGSASVALLPAPVDPEQVVGQLQLMERARELLTHLTPREEFVLRKRFGIDTRDQTDFTLEEIGDELNVGPERIRQIEAKALRKLRHPSRAKLLYAWTTRQSDKETLR